MRHRPRIVIDTNALISRLLLPNSVPGRVVRRAVNEGLLLVSEETVAELADVLGRAKFDPYVSIADRQRFIIQLGRVAEVVRSSGRFTPAAIRGTTRCWRSPLMARPP